jgi:type IV secretion system protein TrbI
VSEAVAAQPAKLDPETLAIRSRPPRAIRFKRGVIIAIAAIGSVSIIAVTWMALKPRLFQGAPAQEELSQPNSRPNGDGLNGTPATYGDVPRLGPPLPGDLGKPILERQQQPATAVNPADQQLQQTEASERERRLAELKAARESGVLVQGRQANAAVGIASATAPAAASATDTPKLALDPANDPNAQGRKGAFVANLLTPCRRAA